MHAGAAALSSREFWPTEKLKILVCHWVETFTFANKMRAYNQYYSNICA